MELIEKRLNKITQLDEHEISFKLLLKKKKNI